MFMLQSLIPVIPQSVFCYVFLFMTGVNITGDHSRPTQNGSCLLLCSKLLVFLYASNISPISATFIEFNNATAQKVKFTMNIQNKLYLLDNKYAQGNFIARGQTF